MHKYLVKSQSSGLIHGPIEINTKTALALKQVKFIRFKQQSVSFTLEPGFVSTADIVTAVDDSLTMLEGLWFICCLDIGEFSLENKTNRYSKAHQFLNTELCLFMFKTPSEQMNDRLVKHKANTSHFHCTTPTILI